MMITPFYAGLFGVLFLILSSRVASARRNTHTLIGDGGNEDMLRAIRVHANFSEYVPLILLLLMMIEMNGHSTTTLHALGITLLVSRVLHAIGLGRTSEVNAPRFVGTLGTWGTLAVSSSILLMDGLPQ